MKNIRILSALLVPVCCVSLAACSDGSARSGVSKEESTVRESIAESADSESLSSDGGEKSDEQIYDDMVARSLISTGDPGRMAKVINKLKNKEEVTVAFIGGSITEGMTAGPQLCWAKLTYDYLCEKYPDAKINYVNAGMSGTPSILGNIRLKRDVTDKNPDLVFVEFAVNDGMEQIYKDSYEALVREILKQENQPAVALYFTVLKNGHTCEPSMSPIGEAYGLPMVSLNNALAPEFQSGRMVWEDYSDDESHPNEWGHQMTRDLIVNMFEKCEEAAGAADGAEIKPLPEEWVYSDRFEGMQLTDRVYQPELISITSAGSFAEKDTLAQFPNGWEVRGNTDESGEPFEFDFTGDNLFMLTLCADSPAYSDIKVTVDGEDMGVYPTSSPDGWGNPQQTLIFSGEKGRHHAVLQPVPQDENKKVLFVDLLGFGITN